METMLKIKAGIMRVLSIVIIFLFAFLAEPVSLSARKPILMWSLFPNT